MKKLAIIAALLLTVIKSSQMNCMDAWTDPYGLNDEELDYANLDTNPIIHATPVLNDNTMIVTAIDPGPAVGVIVYIFHDSKILLRFSDFGLSDSGLQYSWGLPSEFMKFKESSKTTAEIAVNATGLSMSIDNLRALPMFTEIEGGMESAESDHLILLSYVAITDNNIVTDNEYKWFGKDDLPANLAPYVNKNFLDKNLH